MDGGLCRRLVELLFFPDKKVLAPALRAVGNILTGDDRQTQVLNRCTALHICVICVYIDTCNCEVCTVSSSEACSYRSHPLGRPTVAVIKRWSGPWRLTWGHINLAVYCIEGDHNTVLQTRSFVKVCLAFWNFVRYTICV